MKTREKTYDFKGKAGHVSKKRKRGNYYGKSADGNFISGLVQGEHRDSNIKAHLNGVADPYRSEHGSLIEDHVGALHREESSSNVESMIMDANDDNQSSLQAEDNDTQTTQDAELELNSEPRGDVTDVSSSTNSWTVAYDDIASLMCVVESAEELFYEEEVNLEVLRTWYGGVRERLRKLSGTSLPPYSAQKPNLSSRGFDSALTKEDSATDVGINDKSVQASTEVNSISPLVSSEPDSESNDHSVQGSKKDISTSPLLSTEPDLKSDDDIVNYEQSVNWLPVDFIRNLQNITASEGLISIKMGLTGYLLAYYEPQGNFLENVFDSTTLCPLGRHRLDDFTFPYSPNNVFFVNHDMFIISSLLRLYVQEYYLCDGDIEQVINKVTWMLEQYRRPFLSLSSLSENSSWGSVEPNGFCAYLAAATSNMFKATIPTPTLKSVEVRIYILHVLCRCD